MTHYTIEENILFNGMVNRKESKMHVIFLPEWRGGNPYQNALANSLSKENVEVKFASVIRILSLLKAERKPAILHIHWQHPFFLARNKIKTILKSTLFISRLIILKLSGIKIVWTVHNLYNHEERFKAIELFFSSILAQVCDKLIVHTNSAKQKVKETFKIRRESCIKIIPHGNYIVYYENVVNKVQARNQLQLNTEDMIFLCFGLIRIYKDNPELIEAFKKLNVPRAKLLIVGKPCNNEIADEIREKCDMDKNIKLVFEFIPDDEIQVYMNAADVVVLPYRDILTSGAVMLAISFGKSVIAPAIGGIPDILDVKGSFLFDPLESNGLVKSMQFALNADLIKMGKHNFQLAQKFQWSAIGKQTYNVYHECLLSET